MKLIKSENAEAELVGHLIILGITILGVSMIALYGVPAISSLEDMANAKNAEQTFAVLDSHASRAILGGSPLQMTNVNLGGGTLTVEPNSSTSQSYIVVNSTIFNFSIPMGKVKYQLGDRIVAYEGGGVWSKYPSGSVMLSRPEFNYNGVTLTLPVFNLSGNSSVGGKGTAVVSFTKNPAVVLFPNTSLGINRTNPVNYSSIGKVYVNITSDFYDAWADYVSTLSSSKIVLEDPKNRSISIALTVYPAYVGIMNYPSIANPIDFRGLDGSNSTPLNNFSFRIKPDGNQLDWDIRAVSGTKWLFFFIKGTSLNNPGDAVTYLRIGYQDTGLGYAKPAETWEVQGNFTLQSDGYIYVDLLNKSINLTYKDVDVGSDSSSSCNPSKQIEGKFNDTGGFSWGSPVIEGVTNKPLYNITQHYIQKMAQNGDFSFSQCGSHKASQGSTMSIDYIAPGGLTYLHVTDNKADVGIS